MGIQCEAANVIQLKLQKIR